MDLQAQALVYAENVLSVEREHGLLSRIRSLVGFIVRETDERVEPLVIGDGVGDWRLFHQGAGDPAELFEMGEKTLFESVL